MEVGDIAYLKGFFDVENKHVMREVRITAIGEDNILYLYEGIEDSISKDCVYVEGFPHRKGIYK